MQRKEIASVWPLQEGEQSVSLGYTRTLLEILSLVGRGNLKADSEGN